MKVNGAYSTKTSRRAYPAVNIRFTHPVYEAQSVEAEAMIDSGASGTLIPKSIADQLALQPINYTVMKDYQGKVTGKKPLYAVIVKVGSMVFNLDVAETDGHAIIGRDLMNKLTTTLWGRQQKWEMEE